MSGFDNSSAASCGPRFDYDDGPDRDPANGSSSARNFEAGASTTDRRQWLYRPSCANDNQNTELSRQQRQSRRAGTVNPARPAATAVVGPVTTLLIIESFRCTNSCRPSTTPPLCTHPASTNCGRLPWQLQTNSRGNGAAPTPSIGTVITRLAFSNATRCGRCGHRSPAGTPRTATARVRSANDNFSLA